MGGVWPDPLQHAERATESGASQRERSERKLAEASGCVPEARGWTDWKTHITQTRNCTYHRLKLFLRQTQILLLGTGNRGASLGEREGWSMEGRA